MLSGMRSWALVLFISYYPLKQGLKPINNWYWGGNLKNIYILLSIKTRIETDDNSMTITLRDAIYILLSIKTRIETEWRYLWGMGNSGNLYPTIH